MSETNPTVFIVDNDPGSRASLSALVGTLQQVPTLQFATAEDFLQAYRGEPGCLISELQLPGRGALELLDELHTQDRVLPLIVISGSVKTSIAVEVMRRGAVTFLEKPHHEHDVCNAVHAGLNEDVKLRNIRKEQLWIKRRMAMLTEHEYNVMNLMVTGESNKSIAK